MVVSPVGAGDAANGLAFKDARPGRPRMVGSTHDCRGWWPISSAFVASECLKDRRSKELERKGNEEAVLAVTALVAAGGTAADPPTPLQQPLSPPLSPGLPMPSALPHVDTGGYIPPALAAATAALARRGVAAPNTTFLTNGSPVPIRTWPTHLPLPIQPTFQTINATSTTYTLPTTATTQPSTTPAVVQAPAAQLDSTQTPTRVTATGTGNAAWTPLVPALAQQPTPTGPSPGAPATSPLVRPAPAPISVSPVMLVGKANPHPGLTLGGGKSPVALPPPATIPIHVAPTPAVAALQSTTQEAATPTTPCTGPAAPMAVTTCDTALPTDTPHKDTTAVPLVLPGVVASGLGSAPALPLPAPVPVTVAQAQHMVQAVGGAGPAGVQAHAATVALQVQERVATAAAAQPDIGAGGAVTVQGQLSAGAVAVQAHEATVALQVQEQVATAAAAQPSAAAGGAVAVQHQLSAEAAAEQQELSAGAVAVKAQAITPEAATVHAQVAAVAAGITSLGLSSSAATAAEYAKYTGVLQASDTSALAGQAAGGLLGEAAGVAGVALLPVQVSAPDPDSGGGCTGFAPTPMLAGGGVTGAAAEVAAAPEAEVEAAVPTGGGLGVDVLQLLGWGDEEQLAGGVGSGGGGGSGMQRPAVVAPAAEDDDELYASLWGTGGGTAAAGAGSSCAGEGGGRYVGAAIIPSAPMTSLPTGSGIAAATPGPPAFTTSPEQRGVVGMAGGVGAGAGTAGPGAGQGGGMSDAQLQEAALQLLQVLGPSCDLDVATCIAVVQAKEGDLDAAMDALLEISGGGGSVGAGVGRGSGAPGLHLATSALSAGAGGGAGAGRSSMEEDVGSYVFDPASLMAENGAGSGAGFAAASFTQQQQQLSDDHCFDPAEYGVIEYGSAAAAAPEAAAEGPGEGKGEGLPLDLPPPGDYGLVLHQAGSDEYGAQAYDTSVAAAAAGGGALQQDGGCGGAAPAAHAAADPTAADQADDFTALLPPAADGLGQDEAFAGSSVESVDSGVNWNPAMDRLDVRSDNLEELRIYFPTYDAAEVWGWEVWGRDVCGREAWVRCKVRFK